MEHLLYGIAAALIGVCIMTCRLIWRSRGKGPAILVFVLRGSAVLLLFYLAKIALLDYKLSETSPDGQERPRKLLVLQDRSIGYLTKSFDFHTESIRIMLTTLR